MTRLLAWLGGALFVLSLAYTFYFYALPLGNPAPADAKPLPWALAANVVLFAVFAAHHSIFAREQVKRWIERVIPARMERSFYVWVASLLLIVVCVSWQVVAGTLYRIEGVGRWTLYAVQIAGLYLIARAAGVLDPLELAGIRQADPSTRARNSGDEVVFRTDGPFGLVRHPIYLGWIVVTFGAPAMTINRLLFAVITSLYLVAAIPWEERSLVSAFGERYRAYQAQVRWRLIPGLW